MFIPLKIDFQKCVNFLLSIGEKSLLLDCQVKQAILRNHLALRYVSVFSFTGPVPVLLRTGQLQGLLYCYLELSRNLQRAHAVLDGAQSQTHAAPVFCF